MREIKFRAWDKERKELFIPYEISFTKTNGIRVRGGKYIGTRSVELMQYTGLKDKNGKDIWENDIVSWTTEPVNDIVGFKDGTFMIGDVCCFNVPCSNLEVIGNIYENPDLLT